MNVVDIGILAVIGISVIWGFYRGFVHSMLNIAALLLAMLAAAYFGPMLTDALASNAGVTETLATYTDAALRVGDHDLAVRDVSTLGEGLISQVLASVSLPEPIANILRANLTSQSLGGAGMVTVNDYVSGTVIAVAERVLCYLVCFVIAYLALSIVINLIQNVFHFPLLRQLDWLAGGVFGLARGALLVYLLFLLIPIASTIIPLDAFDEVLQASQLRPLFESSGFFASVISPN